MRWNPSAFLSEGLEGGGRGRYLFRVLTRLGVDSQWSVAVGLEGLPQVYAQQDVGLDPPPLDNFNLRTVCATSTNPPALVFDLIHSTTKKWDVQALEMNMKRMDVKIARQVPISHMPQSDF